MFNLSSINRLSNAGRGIGPQINQMEQMASQGRFFCPQMKQIKQKPCGARIKKRRIRLIKLIASQGRVLGQQLKTMEDNLFYRCSMLSLNPLPWRSSSKCHPRHFFKSIMSQNVSKKICFIWLICGPKFPKCGLTQV